MNKKYCLVFIALLCSFFYGFGQTPWVNEIHYDNNGGDLNEGVEIAVPSGYSCGGSLDIIPYNGANGQSYAPVKADIINNNDGSSTSNGVTFYWLNIVLQNGTPDGLALVCSGTIIQFLSYEGSFTATNGPANGMTSTDIGVSEAGTSAVGQSLQLQGTGCQYSDFSWTGSSAHSRNIVNSSQTINCSTSDLAISGTPTDHGSTCVNTAATAIQYTITNNGAIPALNVGVSSNNTEFAVSGFTNGTAIVAGGTATYNITFTPTTTGAKTATITVSSDTTIDATSNLIGTGITTPTITTHPANVSRVIPNTATFNVVASNATSYQWQVDAGTGWNNVTGGAGATTNSYTTAATSAPMNGYIYRCIVTNICGSVNSNAATLTLTNNSPNNVINIVGCFEDNSVVLDWNPPATGATPTGYVVFAIDGGTDPAGTKTDANTYTANSDFSAATPVTPTSLGRVVYKGTAVTAIITGLTEDNNYSFTTYAYVGETLTGWSNGGTNGSTVTNGLAQGDVRNFVATPLTNQVTLNWLNPLPTSCWDDVLIVANQGAVAFTPTGNGSAYTANSVYSGANQVVYKGAGNSVAVTGLTNNTNYCFRAYIRRGTTWTAGVEVCATPTLTYCAASGNTSYETGIRNVTFNTINNNSPQEQNDYSNFTGISTTVNLGEQHNLSVTVDVDGNGTIYTRVWIDWNRNGSFNDSGEEYDLGDAYNSSNTITLTTSTSQSPLSVAIPVNASLGATRMRVSTKWNDPTYATSCETGYSGEVEDYTIVVQQPTGAEINVKGNNITIPNGFTDSANGGLNNTLFGATNVGANGSEKTYTIENIGLATLNLTGAPRVEIIGTNGTGNNEFTVTQLPTNTVASSGISDFKIQFTPLIQGTRTATVRIVNSDSDENPYEFNIQGNATCSGTYTSSIWPVEGPEGTEVTITSAIDLTGASAQINGITMPIVSTSSTELVVTVPIGATDGNLIVLFSNGCSSSNSFDVIDSAIGGCDTSTTTTLSELFISEVTDATSGSSSYVEIFNGTPNPINLSNYRLNIYNNANTSPSSSNALTGTLASGGIHVVSIGSTSCTLNNLNISANQSFSTSSGINFNNNSADMIALYKISTASVVDAYGVFGSDTWSNGLGIGVDGVNFRRKNTASPLPSATFNLADWDIIDWTNCGDSDYVNIGVYDFSLGIPPTITLQPVANNTNCDTSIDLTVTGSEGYAGGLSLVYRWFYLVPGDSTWTEITSDGSPYTGFDQATLNVSFSDAIDVNGYQYYCQIRENSATCYAASNAVKISHERAFWNVNSWSSLPDINKLAIINSNYNTNGSIPNGEISFDACSLIVNAGNTLTIDNNTYVQVSNNVLNYGTIDIQTQGSFVQNGDGVLAGTFTNSGSGIANVSKTTAQFDSTISEINYTYWSSPVNDPNNSGFGQDISTVFPTPVGNRKYYFMAQNYIDSFIETGNNNDNTTDPGQDDIDDNANDWIFATGALEIGRGYAVTASGLPPMPGIFSDASTVFSGALNTGDITVSLYKNNNEISDNNWNFIGNPYPSAISVDDFFAANATVDDVNIDPSENPDGLTEGAIFLWSQSQEPLSGNNGNENINFAQSDYSIINRFAETAGSSTNTKPNRFIPSGQGFFVAFTENLGTPENTVTTGNVIFTNSMRVTGNNDQFFEANDGSQNIKTTDSKSSFESNILWLNLTSDNGVFSQIAFGYADGATNGDDGWSYDTPRNLSTGTYASLHSAIESSDRQFAIQGKNPESLTLNEIIPLGFVTTINEATLYKFSLAQFEGTFLNQNNIYIKDNLFNTIHNLKESDYNFTSEVGEFNNRFEIVFTEEALSVGEVKIDENTLQIIELQNGDVQFKVSSQFEMKSIEIIDLLGRTAYKLNAQGNSQTFILSNLSQATYLAKVELTNGYVITKKALKRR